MDAWHGYNAGDHSWSGMSKENAYKERIAYDANGNILQYLRNGHGSQLNMDSLNYKYYANTNQLRRVRDAVSDGNYTEDLDNQSDTSNYQYDGIGNLIKDIKEGITNIKWTVYGKIKSITKGDGTTINYSYDVAGNRIGKAVTAGGTTTTTWYARDAQGNPMAVYTGTASTLNLYRKAKNKRQEQWQRA